MYSRAALTLLSDKKKSSTDTRVNQMSLGRRGQVSSLASECFNALRVLCPVLEVGKPMFLELGQRRHTWRFQSILWLDLVHQRSFSLVRQDLPMPFARRRCRRLTSRSGIGLVLMSHARDRLRIYQCGPPKPSGGFSRIFETYNPHDRWKVTKSLSRPVQHKRFGLVESARQALVARLTDINGRVTAAILKQL